MPRSIAGGAERAAAFNASASSDHKTALMKEIDYRYFAATGDTTRQPIQTGETGKAALWNLIRDEVLAQDAYIAHLPPQVQELVRTATGGKVLTPADDERLFAIAKKIERMPAGEVADYAAKVRGTTTLISRSSKPRSTATSPRLPSARAAEGGPPEGPGQAGGPG